MPDHFRPVDDNDSVKSFHLYRRRGALKMTVLPYFKPNLEQFIEMRDIKLFKLRRKSVIFINKQVKMRCGVKIYAKSGFG